MVRLCKYPRIVQQYQATVASYQRSPEYALSFISIAATDSRLVLAAECAFQYKRWRIATCEPSTELLLLRLGGIQIRNMSGKGPMMAVVASGVVLTSSLVYLQTFYGMSSSSLMSVPSSATAL
eukprot:1586509-Rhodomonas_salina.2